MQFNHSHLRRGDTTTADDLLTADSRFPFLCNKPGWLAGSEVAQTAGPGPTPADVACGAMEGVAGL